MSSDLAICIWYSRMIDVLEEREFTDAELESLRLVADTVAGSENAVLKDEILLLWWLAELRFADNDISKIDLSWSDNLKGESNGGN